MRWCEWKSYVAGRRMRRVSYDVFHLTSTKQISEKQVYEFEFEKMTEIYLDIVFCIFKL